MLLLDKGLLGRCSRRRPRLGLLRLRNILQRESPAKMVSRQRTPIDLLLVCQLHPLPMLEVMEKAVITLVGQPYMRDTITLQYPR